MRSANEVTTAVHIREHDSTYKKMRIHQRKHNYQIFFHVEKTQKSVQMQKLIKKYNLKNS